MSDLNTVPLLDVLRQAIEGQHFPMPLADHTGFRVAEASEGAVTIELAPREVHHNIAGTVHGGVLCEIADSAMGLAFGTTLPPGQSFTTIELKMNFLRPVFEKTVRAKGVVVHRGRNLGLMECRVEDEDGKLVAFATSTYTILNGDTANGREIKAAFGGKG